MYNRNILIFKVLKMPTSSYFKHFNCSKTDGELADGLAGVHVGFKCER